MDTYDINVLGNLNAPQPSLTVDGTCINGIAKLVQKVMIVLLSDERSDFYGTYIPQMLSGSNVPDSGAVENIFNIAMTEVSDVIKGAYTSETPDDEKLASYAISFGDSEEDTISVNIKITAVSGENTVLKFPQPFINKES